MNIEDYCRIPWHYGDTGIMMSPAVRPRTQTRETKCFSWRHHTPRPRNKSNDFKKTSSITVRREDSQKIPQVSVRGVEGVPLTRGFRWHVVTMWHPDNIGNLVTSDILIRAEICPPDTETRGGHHHQCRLQIGALTDFLMLRNSHKAMGLMLHKTFICLSF